jgi:hypothetical protein
MGRLALMVNVLKSSDKVTGMHKKERVCLQSSVVDQLRLRKPNKGAH